MNKKKYTKPQIVLESFSLSTSVSAGCELKTTLSTKEDACAYPTREGMVFVEGTQCNKYPSDGVYDEFCYHVPTDEKNLFNS